MKAAMIAALGLCLLAGCAQGPTLAEARAACAKQGGFLVVIHKQKLTTAGLGEQVDSPGDCVSSGKFDASRAGKPAN